MTKAVVYSIKNHVKRAEPAKRRRRAAGPRRPWCSVSPLPAEKPRPRANKKKLIEESRRWLSIINAHKLNDYKRRKVVDRHPRQLPASTTTAATSSTGSR